MFNANVTEEKVWELISWNLNEKINIEDFNFGLDKFYKLPVDK